MNKIRNKREVTIDTTHKQSTMREYYKKLYANKLGSLEKVDKKLYTHTKTGIVVCNFRNQKRKTTEEF